MSGAFFMLEDEEGAGPGYSQRGGHSVSGPDRRALKSGFAAGLIPGLFQRCWRNGPNGAGLQTVPQE